VASLGANAAAALRSLREQPQRSFLSTLGIIVGSMAVVLLVSIATGVQADVRGQVQDIGVNVLVVIPGRIENGPMNMNLGGGSFLKEEDALRLTQVAGVVRTAPWTFVGGGIRSGEKVANSLLVATTDAWFQMHPEQMEAGRVFAPGDREKDVCVIGSFAKQQLFGDRPALGKPILVNKRRYTVVGVTKDRKGQPSLLSMFDLQNLVYLPYHRLKAFQPDLQTDRIMIQTVPSAEPKALIRQLDAVLAQRLDRQQFQVLTQEDLLGLVYKLMGILTWLLTGLTSIALFVGGVGIMTVMLMSVNERAKEIGLRKTVGARQRDIFTQFLSEAIVLGLAGGTVGLALSYGVCLALYHFTPIKPMVTPGIVALAFSVSLGVGTVFGLVPAMNAARKDPVVSLRSQ
jgi:putative ABC transport system permease protein